MRVQNCLLSGVVVLSFLGFAGGLRADTVSLSSDAFSTGTNNYQVNVGETFVVQVLLSDVTTPGGLGFLGADVVFDGAFLSGPTGDVVTPGSIVPDTTGFLGGSFSASGATGNYDQLFVDVPLGPVIDSTGEFFRFQLTAVAPGIAQISFLDAAGSDVDGNPITPTLANSLRVEVLGTAAPLPSAAWGGLALLSLLFVVAVRQRVVN